MQLFVYLCVLRVDYEELAVALAQDSDRLYDIRQQLEQRRMNCAAYDTARWVRNFESGLLAAWKRYEKGQTPDHITVEDSEPIFKESGHDIFA